MKAAVVVFPGSNCDRDAAAALRAATGRAPAMVWHRETELPDVDLVVLPGGFAYGDYLRPGAIAARAPAMRAVAAMAARGVAVLGICNGFQILTEAGLLPGALVRNAGLRFVCREVGLRVGPARSPFTAGYAAGAAIRLPVATTKAITRPTPRPWRGSKARGGSPSATTRKRPAPTARRPASPASSMRPGASSA